MTGPFFFFFPIFQKAPTAAGNTLCTMQRGYVRSPRNVSARLMDCEESAVWKPRPLAGIIVDWQMKVLTELAPSPFSLWESVTDRSVTLSVHTASWPLDKEREQTEKGVAIHPHKLLKGQYFLLVCVCVCVFISSHLSPTQADVKLVEVLGSFGGEARTVHQRSHRPEEAEVKSQSGVALGVGEVTVAVT